MSEFFRLAFRRDVVRRSLVYAVIVGGILVAINHGTALLAGQLDSSRVWRIALTVVVPYIVSTSSSVGALRESRRRRP
ncbi:MAG: hypothetical protein Kow0062_05650 [Acidobacteriota bacterium]